jgi:hypothetical protein
MGINTGALYIIVILLLLFGIAFLLTGPLPGHTSSQTGVEVMIGKADKIKGSPNRLQLIQFSGATITPPASSVCSKGGKNTHPEAIIGYSPAHGSAVSTTGQIKIWVNDKTPLKIAPAESVNRNSGTILSPGDRTATAPDGYLWEPAIYIFPNTVDTNGQAFFPSGIHGAYNNGSDRVSYGIEQLPPGAAAANGPFTVEYTWEIADLGLRPGAYQLQFVVHDGSDGRAVGCIAIRVYESPESQNAKNRIPI